MEVTQGGYGCPDKNINSCVLSEDPATNLLGAAHRNMRRPRTKKRAIGGVTTTAKKLNRSFYSATSILSALAAYSAFSVISAFSCASFGSLVSIASVGSLMSVASIGSILSITSTGSVLSYNSKGCIFKTNTNCVEKPEEEQSVPYTYTCVHNNTNNASLAQGGMEVDGVFILYGQSNSECYGRRPSNFDFPGSDRLRVLCNGSEYAYTEPMACSTTWPTSWACPAADISISRNNTADVFAVAGCGGFSVEQLYRSRHDVGNILDVLSQAASMYQGKTISVLFHQGESDSHLYKNTDKQTYINQLTSLKASADEIYAADWYISRATYERGSDASIDHNIRDAQWSIPGTFRGPDSDTLRADYRHDGVHFNFAGMVKMGQLWNDAINARVPAIYAY